MQILEYVVCCVAIGLKSHTLHAFAASCRLEISGRQEFVELMLHFCDVVHAASHSLNTRRTLGYPTT